MGGVGRAKQSLSLGLGILLVFTIGPGAATGTAYQITGTAPTGSTDSSYPGQGVPATAEELQSAGSHVLRTSERNGTCRTKSVEDPEQVPLPHNDGIDQAGFR